MVNWVMTWILRNSIEACVSIREHTIFSKCQPSQGVKSYLTTFEKLHRSLCFRTRSHEGLKTNFSKVSSRRVSKVRWIFLRNSIEACVSVREHTKALIQISRKLALAGCQRSDHYSWEILSKPAFQYASARRPWYKFLKSQLSQGVKSQMNI